MGTVKKSLLFVTNESELKESVYKNLKSGLYRVVIATNDSEARLKVVGEQFNFIIIDMDMEDFNPHSFTKNIRHKEKLKGIKKLVPIIVLGESSDHFQKDFNQFEQTSFLDKPLDYEELKTKFAVLGVNNIVEEHTREVEKGSVLIHEGSASSEMYWVLKGRFVASKKGPDKEVVIGDVGTGELIGEMSFLDSRSRSATITALENSEVLVIPHKKFVHAMDGQPRWFQTLMKTLSLRLRNSNDIICGKEEMVVKINELQRTIEEEQE